MKTFLPYFFPKVRTVLSSAESLFWEEVLENCLPIKKENKMTVSQTSVASAFTSDASGLLSISCTPAALWTGEVSGMSFRLKNPACSRKTNFTASELLHTLPILSLFSFETFNVKQTNKKDDSCCNSLISKPTRPNYKRTFCVQAKRGDKEWILMQRNAQENNV